MYSIETYIDNVKLLINNLVIKIDGLAEQVNNGLLYNDPNYQTLYDKREWKYYLNISGEKHYTNSNVMVYVTELNESRPLTKELMSTYKNTRNILRDKGVTYRQLLLEYPNDRAYINGVLMPVDIDTAINAPQGTVLAYDRRHVEYSELSLIRDIENFAKSFLARWHIKDYLITDDLYMASVVASLYSSLLGYVLACRVRRIHTNEVHSFHMEHFFRSNKDIWQYVQQMNNISKYWLYNNIKYLTKNVGKNNIIEKIALNIFEENGLGIGHYNLTTTDPTINTSGMNDPAQPSYIKGDNILVPTPGNAIYSVTSEPISIYNLILYQLIYDATIDIDMTEDRASYYAQHITNKISNINNTTQRTKVFDISTTRLWNNMHNVNMVQNILDHWTYVAYRANYPATIFFTDPNTLQSYELTFKQGLLYVYKMLAVLLGNGTFLMDTYTHYTLLNIDITLEELLDNTISTEDMEYPASVIMDYIPRTYNNIQTAEGFKEYLDIANTLYTNVWLMDANVNNVTMSATIKDMVKKIFIVDTVDLKVGGSPIDLDVLLASEGINITISDNYNAKETLTNLFQVFTGYRLSKYESVSEYLDNFISIFNRLTSYTTQILKSIDDSEHSNISYNSTNVFNSKTGIISVVDAEIETPYSPLPATIYCEATTFSDRLDVIVDIEGPNIESLDCSLKGVMLVRAQEQELIGGVLEPIVYTEVIEEC